MDIFKIYRFFWDFCFSNPEKIKPTHIAIFSFAVEHCNRLGWKPKFGFPTTMVMEATGIKSYSVYKKHFDDLHSFGLIDVIEFSKNQFSSNVIALKENYKANDKALDKALVKHLSKQTESTYQSTTQSTSESISSVNKQETKEQITSIQLTNTLIESNIQKVEILSILSFDEFWNLYDKKVGDKTKLQKCWDSIKEVERRKIKEHIPMYIMSRPDKKFRKDPQTYLNNKSWNDEIILESETIKPIQELPTIKRKYL